MSGFVNITIEGDRIDFTTNIPNFLCAGILAAVQKSVLDQGIASSHSVKVPDGAIPPGAPSQGARTIGLQVRRADRPA